MAHYIPHEHERKYAYPPAYAHFPTPPATASTAAFPTGTFPTAATFSPPSHSSHTSSPTTPVTPDYPVFQQQQHQGYYYPVYPVSSPLPSQSPPEQCGAAAAYTPTNYHLRKCTGKDNMGTQCVPRIDTNGLGLYECMYCQVMLMFYVPGESAMLLPLPPYTASYGANGGQ